MRKIFTPSVFCFLLFLLNNPLLAQHSGSCGGSHGSYHGGSAGCNHSPGSYSGTYSTHTSSYSGYSHSSAGNYSVSSSAPIHLTRRDRRTNRVVDTIAAFCIAFVFSWIHNKNTIP